LKKFGLKPRKKDMEDWLNLSKKIKKVKKEVKIGIVGKYFTVGEFVLSDAYISVIEAVKHACWQNNVKPVIKWLDSGVYEQNKGKLKELDKYDGIIVPGGFGSRGVEGKILAAQYCRENKIPYFGLCYGMQLAVVEFARHVAGLKNAHTTEIDPEAKDPVIHIMPEQEKLLAKQNYGNTMRLGAWPCVLKPNTISFEAYGVKQISERHRHRYEFNNHYRDILEKNGLVLAGASPDGKLIEIVELPKKQHPFYVGVQFHPEFKSRPVDGHPLFNKFIEVAIKRNNQ
jgi:CTP synthase